MVGAKTFSLRLFETVWMHKRSSFQVSSPPVPPHAPGSFRLAECLMLHAERALRKRNQKQGTSFEAHLQNKTGITNDNNVVGAEPSTAFGNNRLGGGTTGADDERAVFPRAQGTAIWTVDACLQLRSRAMRCLQMFSVTSLTLVHPALLDEKNVTWFLALDLHSLVASPISLNLTIAFCLGAKEIFCFCFFTIRFLPPPLCDSCALGARALGESKIEEELWESAREQLESLFDSSDFHVATALARMFEYAMARGQRRQGELYVRRGGGFGPNLSTHNGLRI